MCFAKHGRLAMEMDPCLKSPLGHYVNETTRPVFLLPRWLSSHISSTLGPLAIAFMITDGTTLEHSSSLASSQPQCDRQLYAISKSKSCHIDVPKPEHTQEDDDLKVDHCWC